MRDKKEDKEPDQNDEVPEEETLEADAVHPESGVFSKARPLGRTFASFYHRDFSLLWVGSLLSNIGTWIQITAVNWVVFLLTKPNSALPLGAVNFLNSFPVFLFVLYAGSLADRVSRRRILLITQTALLIFALALGILTTVSRLTLFWIYFLTFATGVGTAFTFPTWQAIIPDLVPRRNLMNAIALNSAQFNGARMVGPAIAGVVLAAFGAATNFYANAVSFLAVIVALLLIRPRPVVTRSTEGGWAHLTEGIRYSRIHWSIGLLLIYIGILSVFGLSYIVLLPIFAGEILKSGAQAYGFLAAAAGLGSVAGALTVASIAHMANRSLLVKWTVAAAGGFLILFALSSNLYLSLVLLVGVGFAFLASTSMINTIIQESVPNVIRGRVMSIYIWMFLGLQPFGSLAYGA
ncbi:MAG: MFS transporter, partial [Chloroflexi bacterium]|nr:MFS transporter [Chloroflexota bacterium]